MWKSAAVKTLVFALACSVAGAPNFAASPRGSHGSHGGGSHGGGGGHFHGGSVHGSKSHSSSIGHFGGNSGSRRSAFSGMRQSSATMSNRGPGFFSSPGQYRGSGSAPDFANSANRAYSARASSAAYSAPRANSKGNWSNSNRATGAFGSDRPPSPRSTFRATTQGSSAGSRNAFDRSSGYASSFGANRPPSVQRNSSYGSAREGWGSGRGTPSGRVLSTDVNRQVNRGGSSASRLAPRTTAAFGREMNRAGAFEDRPPSARPNTSNVSARANSYLANASYSNMNRGRNSFGNSRFAGAGLTSTSFSGVGSGRFTGVRSSNFGRNGFGGSGVESSRFGYNNFGRGNFGYGGYGHRGFGYGGNDFWFLRDLFGLALDLGGFAWSPWAPVGLLGWDLLNSGIQALDSLDNNGQQSYSNQPQPYPDDQQPLTPLCGAYYSDENPGCQQ